MPSANATCGSSNLQGDAKGAASLFRCLCRLVLLTWLAAQAPLAAAQARGLSALGLKGPHAYAATFELTAFDVLLERERAPEGGAASSKMPISAVPRMSPKHQYSGQRLLKLTFPPRSTMQAAVAMMVAMVAMVAVVGGAGCAHG